MVNGPKRKPEGVVHALFTGGVVPKDVDGVLEVIFSVNAANLRQRTGSERGEHAQQRRRSRYTGRQSPRCSYGD